MEERIEENKDTWRTPLLILLDSSFISPFYIFLFLYTSFIFDCGHVTDLLRYVFLMRPILEARVELLQNILLALWALEFQENWLI